MPLNDADIKIVEDYFSMTFSNLVKFVTNDKYSHVPLCM